MEVLKIVTNDRQTDTQTDESQAISANVFDAIMTLPWARSKDMEPTRVRGLSRIPLRLRSSDSAVSLPAVFQSGTFSAALPTDACLYSTIFQPGA